MQNVYLYMPVTNYLSGVYNVSAILYRQCKVQGGSNITGTNCDLFTHKLSRSYLNHLVYVVIIIIIRYIFMQSIYTYIPKTKYVSVE
jgi:hypothetical protein